MMSANCFRSKTSLQSEQVPGDDGSTPRKINNLLNSSRSRFEGLQLLNSFLPRCSDEDFVQFCIGWMQNCCKIEGLARNNDYAIRLLNDLFRMSSNYQELKKPVSFFITTRYFDFFFKYFLHSQAGWSCTETCMLLYRGACGPFQESLEKHLKFEAGKKEKILSTVAHCYALLPSVGGGGNKGICYLKNWRTWFVKFLSITHSLLKDLFADVDELQEYEAPEQVYDRFENENSVSYLTFQIHNHCTVLSCMLLNEYPAPKSIPTDLIFQLVCRGLAVTPKALAKSPTTNSISIAEVLPEIHCSFLTLLKAVIVTCKSQLLPYSHLVCKLIRQTLEWTESELTCGKEKPFGQLRVSAYETLCNWLASTGNGSCAEVISSVVISSATNDLMSKKKVVFLKEANHQSQSVNREQTRRISGTANDRLCRAALKALQFLVQFVGGLLRPEEHKFLQETTVKLILQVQRSVSDAMVPFSVSSCRLELYALLVELILQPCPKRPPPTHFALKLLNAGLNDGCPQVSSFCSMALSMMTVIIHPQYSNGGFPPCEAPENKSQTEVQLQWKNVSDHEESVVNSKGGELEGEQCVAVAVSSDSGDVGSKDKASHPGDESGGSSGEDSRSTVTFSKHGGVSSDDKPDGAEETQERLPSETKTAEDEPSAKVRRTATESSHAGTSEVAESDQVEPPESSAKTASPEYTSEEGQAKTRYYLRSKAKASSEEPEESIRRTVSLDSLKNTPVRASHRGSPSVQGTGKRPRRVLSKTDANGGGTESGALKKTPGHDGDGDDDDDEDILAAFDESLAD